MYFYRIWLVKVKYDGWDKLCKFLEIEEDKIPNEPFPHSNARQRLHTIQNEWRQKAYGFDVFMIGIGMLTSMFAYKLYIKKT